MLEKLIEQSLRTDESKADYTAMARNFVWDEKARIVPPQILGLQSVPLTMTTHALDQIRAKLGPAVFGKGANKQLPKDFFEAIPPELLAYNLNDIVQGANGNEWKVRATGTSARAVLAGDYPGGANQEGHYENTQYLTALDGLLEDQAPRLPDLRIDNVRSYVSADLMRVNAIWRDDPRGNGGGYGIGGLIGNSEIGTGTLFVWPAVKRSSCDNSLVVDDDKLGVRIFHYHGMSLKAMMMEFKKAIGMIIGAGAEILNRILEAEEEELPDFDDVLNGLAEKHGWPIELRMNVAQGTENQHTRMGLVNGVTWAAKTFKDPEERLEYEILGGRLLMASDATLASYAVSAR